MEPKGKKMADKIKVMIVDDSFSIRMLLRGIISAAPDMEIIATARDPLDAIEKLKEFTPDVMTLDVEMPNMDGLTFLEKLMKQKPLPVVMISTLTHKGSTEAVKALELGAIDIIGKPSANADDLKPQAEEIITRVREASYARVGNNKAKAPPAKPAPSLSEKDTSYATADIVLSKAPAYPADAPPLIAIGASTGGTEAIRALLTPLPTTLPGIVITQHMAPGFIKSFAKRLDSLCKITVQEAKDGMKIEEGKAYIASTDSHLAIKRRGNIYICQKLEGRRVRRHKPSVDVMFRSVANEVGSNATGILLTGMGDDGAEGLKEMKSASAYTIAQDEASCVVFGMPRAAIKINAQEDILPLEKMASTLISRFK